MYNIITYTYYNKIIKSPRATAENMIRDILNLNSENESFLYINISENPPPCYQEQVISEIKQIIQDNKPCNKNLTDKGLISIELYYFYDNKKICNTIWKKSNGLV